MEPTEYDIRKEVEALRDIRRRSTTPGALALDPDLPNQGPPSPTSPYHASTSALPAQDSPQQSPSPSSSDDPFHLFWVPASLHPEIAPAEFRAFLKEHARNPNADDNESNALQRSSSSASTVPSGLGRKKSMLSRPYQPKDHENDASDDTVVPLRRNRSSIYSTNQNQGPQLTISDLQKLEELSEEASGSDDPAKLRNIIRRSLSLNVSPLALGDLDEADQPIVVAPPGQFLRRTARTRIRKPGLPGDGNGHRFGERRRGPPRSETSPILQRTSSDVSSSDHGESSESVPPHRARTFSDEGPSDRPDSFSEEALIYDAYAHDEEEDMPPPRVVPPVLITESPPSNITEFPEFADVPPPQPAPEIPQPTLQPAPRPALDPVIHQPQPTRLLSPVPADAYQQPPQTLSPSRTPSPDASPTGTPASSPPSSSFLSTSPSPRKDKDKKGLFGKWGAGDKEKEAKPGKGSKKEKERERVEKERREKEQRDKESGFFGSLFGSKKKQDSTVPEPGPVGLHGGREAAHALLGQSQRAPKSPGPPSPMGMGVGMVGGAGGVNNYSRYPIHVERAIYRLSHIKLANPRRPLYEQVLISNLMFWYLGVINKAQAGAQEAAAQQAAQQAGPAVNGQGPATGEGEKEKAEQERAEREVAAAAAAEKERVERERVERERLERERAEREQWEREMEQKKREASPRRGALTKAIPPGGPPPRRAEMPVKGPQYEMQHRSMEKEYAGYNGGPPVRANNAQIPGPIGVGGGIAPGQVFPRVQQNPTSPKFNQQQFVQPPPGSQGPEQHYYYSPGEAMQQQRLPPGAMPPVDQSTWLVGQPPPAARKHTSGGSSPPPTVGAGPAVRRSRSPPPPGMNHHPSQGMPVYNPDGGQGGARLGGRSLSATAVPSPSPPPMNGKIRKGQSAYAGGGANGHGRRGRDGNGEEEDVPLAVWQKQQRR
ncbi:hypothetical protein DFH07DRAFT_304958 [Mycena maculata]|uniref:Protein Zds1 C-terminal domain-containing protein n=1 Tax=Mycena maculata TaxID=230809 RepID=A0AAD7HGY8_9AGAR|nr:hypothetical protein DFH07DRAFT_304958 [Mycena maculata]